MTMIDYDYENDILTLVNKKGTTDSMAIGSMIFDYNKDNEIISIEILDATKFFESFTVAKSDFKNFKRVKPSKEDLKGVKQAELVTVKSHEWSENKQLDWHHIIITLEIGDRKIKIQKEVCIPYAELPEPETEKEINIDWDDFEDMVEVLHEKLKDNKELKYIYPIARGGYCLGVRLSHLLGLKMIDEYKVSCVNKYNNNKEVLVCDDTSDKGNTLLPFRKSFRIATLHYRPTSKVEPNYYATKLKKGDMRWVNYPWEKKIGDGK